MVIVSFKTSACRYAPTLFRTYRMVPMAGRPRKDPTGADLIPTTFKMRADAKRVAIAAARRHGMTLTDYLHALIAEDNPTELQSVPMLQEVLPQSA